MGKLAEAIKKKYESPAQALRALGLDPTLLDDEGDGEMANQFNKAAYNQAYSAALTAAKKMIALDEEVTESSSIEERLKRLEALFEDLISADALHRFGGGRDSDLYEDLGEQGENGWVNPDRRARDRRGAGAKDMPPPFEGRPRGGAADPEVMKQREEYDRRVNDRKSKGFGAHDAALGLKRPHSTPAEVRSFHSFFPDAKRIIIG